LVFPHNHVIFSAFTELRATTRKRIVSRRTIYLYKKSITSILATTIWVHVATVVCSWLEGVAAGDFLLGTDGGIRTVQTSMVAVATLYLYDSSMFEETDNGLEMCDMLGKI
jgi:hypothetical protein